MVSRPFSKDVSQGHSIRGCFATLDPWDHKVALGLHCRFPVNELYGWACILFDVYLRCTSTHMYICIYVYIYICICVYMYICVYICIYVDEVIKYIPYTLLVSKRSPLNLELSVLPACRKGTGRIPEGYQKVASRLGALLATYSELTRSLLGI